jgi:hypothetical protein
MRKTIAFFLSVGILAAALVGTGCKPRNVRELVMPFVPGVKATACATSGTIVFQDDEDYYFSGQPSNLGFTSCDHYGNQYVYELQVNEDMPPGDDYLHITAYNTDNESPVHLSFHTSCTPGAGQVVCEDYSDCCPYMSSLYAYYGRGTYYLVVSTPDEFDGYINVHWCD